MPTKNPRINVTFEEEAIKVLTHLAAKSHKSVASFVRELTLESLEKREDRYLSKIADELDQEGTETYSHSEAWK